MAKNTFIVNGVTYVAKPFDFDLVCELEEMGVTFERIDKMPMSLIRAYFAICADTDKEQASALIQNHMIKGGKLDDVTNAMGKEMEESDFFRALTQDEEQTSTESENKTRTRKAKDSEKQTGLNTESDNTSQLNFG